MQRHWILEDSVEQHSGRQSEQTHQHQTALGWDEGGGVT